MTDNLDGHGVHFNTLRVSNKDEGFLKPDAVLEMLREKEKTAYLPNSRKSVMQVHILIQKFIMRSITSVLDLSHKQTLESGS